MAYASKETVANIRKALKAKFPEIKFSVVNDSHTAVRVSVMKSKYDFGVSYHNINEHHIESDRKLSDEHKALFIEILKTIKEAGDWFDKSDSMTDYFNTAFYIYLKIGKDNKPYECA
jgi:hypothetical protein